MTYVVEAGALAIVVTTRSTLLQLRIQGGICAVSGGENIRTFRNRQGPSAIQSVLVLRVGDARSLG